MCYRRTDMLLSRLKNNKHVTDRHEKKMRWVVFGKNICEGPKDRASDEMKIKVSGILINLK